MGEVLLLDVGDFSGSDAFGIVMQEVKSAIAQVTWPPGADKFGIYPEAYGNGVVPVHKDFVDRLKALGWVAGERFPLLMPKEFASFGAIDATRSLAGQNELPFAVEWETGNISSSHRSVNKMVRGLQAGVLSGAALIVPTAGFAFYLTNRIGNMRELLPYVHMWRSVTIARGYLSILTVEHDYTSEDVPKIPKRGSEVDES